MIKLDELLEKILTSTEYESKPYKPVGCVGSEEQCSLQHHRSCVVAERWLQQCQVMRCNYRDPNGERPEWHNDNCPGWHGRWSLKNGECQVLWSMCERRRAYIRAHRPQEEKRTKERSWRDG